MDEKLGVKVGYFSKPHQCLPICLLMILLRFLFFLSFSLFFSLLLLFLWNLFYSHYCNIIWLWFQPTVSHHSFPDFYFSLFEVWHYWQVQKDQKVFIFYVLNITCFNQIPYIIFLKLFSCYHLQILWSGW